MNPFEGWSQANFPFDRRWLETRATTVNPDGYYGSRTCFGVVGRSRIDRRQTFGFRWIAFAVFCNRAPEKFEAVSDCKLNYASCNKLNNTRVVMNWTIVINRKIYINCSNVLQ